MKKLRLHLELLKLPMSLMITLSAAFGYTMHGNAISPDLLCTGAGILMLACGGACLNNYQDRRFDRLFSRTRHRALPARAIPPKNALVLSAVLIAAGTLFLFFIRHDLILPISGILAIILYNGIYTPLKPRTVLAIFPGALCGMIPPLIGWIAAGGSPFSLKIMSIMVLFGLWQFPHFWLILLNHDAEYRRSAPANMLHHFTRRQLKRIVFMWILNFGVLLLIIPRLFWGESRVLQWIFLLSACALIFITFFNLFIRRRSCDFNSLFKFLSCTVLFIVLAAIFDQLI